MKNTKFLHITVLTALFLIALLAPRPVRAQERVQSLESRQRGYMSQTFVDTTVLRAILILNETTAPGNVNRNHQSHAINRAKSVLDALRERAKGDPNEQYALAKISEVEYQIHLELEELRKIDANRQMQTINQLVLEYNSEVGKNRPDFAKLRAIVRRMFEVDVRRANNMVGSYNNRYKNIAREAMHSLDRALNANDFVTAKRELEYCERNRTFLVISSEDLATRRARLDGMQDAHGDLVRVTNMLNESEKAYNEYRLSECRMNVTLASTRLNNIRAGLPQSEANALSARAARLVRELDRREDSLVTVALNVLDIQGGDAAYEYFNNVLQTRMNLSQERAAIVDQAIMAMMPEREITLGEGVAMVEIRDINVNNNEMAEIQNRARQRAQARADSLRREKARAEQTANDIYATLGRRARDAARMFARDTAFLKAMLDNDAYLMLERSVSHGSKVSPNLEDFKRNRERAEQYVIRIFALIENNDSREARQRFQRYKRAFQKYLDTETFYTLETAVTQSNNNRRAARNR